MKSLKRLYEVYLKSLKNRLTADLLRAQILPSNLQVLIDAESCLVQMHAHPLLLLQWLVLQ